MPITYEFAEHWLQVIAIGAAVLWAAGGLFVFLSAQVVKLRVEAEVPVTMDPKTVVQRAKELLTRGVSGSPMSGVRLLEVKDDSLVWEGGSARLRHSASLRASGSAGRTRLAWQLEAHSGLITGAIWVTGIGAATIMGLYLLLYEHVLPSDVPAVRGQIFQMSQAIHLLWPPFLLAGLARSAKRQLVRDLERTLGNMQFDAAT